MIKPLVSIIVPIYKVEKYLDKCINSLLNQTLKNIEIILIDDGSPDNCPQMCDEYQKVDNRIKVIHKHNEGQGYARNCGLKIATGEYIAYVDSDDYIDFNMYENLYTIANQNNFDVVYCGVNRVSSNLHFTKFKKVDKLLIFIGIDEIKGFLLNMVGTKPNCSEDIHFSVSACLGIYSHKIIDNFSIIFESERLFISEDTLYNISFLSKSKKIGFVPETYYHYRQHDKSFCHSYIEGKYFKEKIFYLEINKRLNNIMDIDDFILRTTRTFIGNVRSVISVEVANIGKNSFNKVRDNIKTICADEFLQEILIQYPVKELPLLQKIFIIFLIKKYIICIILLCYINKYYKYLF
ncbi:MAG TPA: glycosyltransferase [Candidatus Paceibacterota bacterium]